jgi:hypothetical protein
MFRSTTCESEKGKYGGEGKKKFLGSRVLMGEAFWNSFAEADGQLGTSQLFPQLAF